MKYMIEILVKLFTEIGRHALSFLFRYVLVLVLGYFALKVIGYACLGVWF